MDRSLYSRPNKPKFIEVKKRDRSTVVVPPLEASKQPVFVHKTTECHVTPADVATRMVAFAGGDNGGRWCDLSAGTGNLLKAMISSGVNPCRITAIEIELSLCEVLRRDFPFVNLVESCCLSYYSRRLHGDGYSRIILNPPFKRVHAHMGAAVGMLKDGGVLVAVVPVTFDVDGYELLEVLPPDTFANAKVHTKVVRFVK